MCSVFFILFLALLIDRFIGDPQIVWDKVPHPVVLFGKAIELSEKKVNIPTKSSYLKRRDGFVVMLLLLAMSGAIGYALHRLVGYFDIFGLVLEALAASIFLAQKSLADHVSAVALALKNEGLVEGRKAVSMIVGRDPQQLDEAGVCRAAIESLAENSSDGVVAPAFWYLIGGLPGLFAYKMLNTGDSMIGHMSERYRDFGRFTAKLDDVANWIPARLTGFLIVAASAVLNGLTKARNALSIMLRDARSHRSPNAGWPETAMAGALGLALGGPRRYGSDIANEPVLNGAGRRIATGADIDVALRHFWLSMTLLTLLAIIAAIL